MSSIVKLKEFDNKIEQFPVIEKSVKVKQMHFNANRKILSNLCIFIFNEIVIPLLRNNFYSTERHGENSKLFYYRKPIWNLISKLAIS